MASSGPPVKKFKKRSTPATTLSAAARARQYPDDLYEDGGILFCKVCCHSLNFMKKDTINDHLKSKKHCVSKEALKLRQSQHNQSKPSTSKQMTITSCMTSKNAREEFILDLIQMMTTADIPLSKIDKMKPFLQKYCKQGGSVPQQATLRQLHLPQLFNEHQQALKKIIQSKSAISIVVDETTDCRDWSILNILFLADGEKYLVECIALEKTNHSTVSQAIIKTVTDYGVDFNKIQSVVTDSAAYCIKAFRDVLSAIFPNAKHVRCLAHILNLVGDIFIEWKDFVDVHTFCTMLKSSFFKKPARKRRYLAYLADYLPQSDVKLPPEPVKTRWRTWFNAISYHHKYLHVYDGFFRTEKSEGIAVDKILEIIQDKSRLLKMRRDIVENASKCMDAITYMEGTTKPLAITVYNRLEDLHAYLEAGSTKLSMGRETDLLIESAPACDKNKLVRQYQKVFKAATAKFVSHVDVHPVMPIYKCCRLLDPRQVPATSSNLSDYEPLPGFSEPTQALIDEFLIYRGTAHSLEVPENFTFESFWQAQKSRFPELSTVALSVMWMPVASVDVERSFSQYKTLLSDKREKLTEQSTKMLLMLYCNGDVSDRMHAAPV